MSARARSTRRTLAIVAVALATALCSAAIATRLRLDPNVASLLPRRGEAAALRRYLRAFGGSDLALVLVHSPRAGDAAVAEVKDAAETIAAELRAQPTVRAAAASVDVGRALDPMLAWRHADLKARARLEQALTEDGMRARLRESRAMLLAPGAGAASEMIARDPLRLGAILAETHGVGGGFAVQADGSFASEDGLSRLVLVFPEGQALRGADAKAFTRQARAVLGQVAAPHPDLRIGLTGGHAIAEATERMLIRDMELSGTLSMLLCAVAFVLTFRRVRALWAVMPPLVLGTVWTAGLAAMLPAGLSAIAVAFMSVVIGVGVDTGVHVYAELLEARRAGLDPRQAALVARRRTQRPVLVAVAIAAAAFGALELSEIGAVRQLGLLCGAGELLTAVAIVIVTPEIGAWLERGPAPAATRQRWVDAVDWLTVRPLRARVLLVVVALPLALAALGVRPAIAESVIALRPAGLPPLQVQDEIWREFGGRRGQWVVLMDGADRQQAMARADRLFERLTAMTADVEAVDGLTALAPALTTQRARLAERDALLTGKAAQLQHALAEAGFRPARFSAALDAMRHPSHEVVTPADVDRSGAGVMLSRYLGRDGDELAAIYVLPRAGHEADVEEAIRRADPGAAITGYSRLEAALRATLQADLPRIGAVAALLVVIALGLSLRRALDVVLAAAVIATEIGIVLFAVRVLRVPLHAYDALVLPVLLGITVDEAMFLLHRARAADPGRDVVPETLHSEGPAVAATALTTAAGFLGLGACDFDGLRHLGYVGAIGSTAGLLVAFVIVPAGLRLARQR